MTSVPTWLVALVPVLSVVVGGLLSWLATTRTAEQNAALARQEEHRRWKRERRENTYVALLDARDRYVQAQMEFGLAREDGQRYKREVDIGAASRTAFESRKELEKVLAQVELVGTTAAGQFARTWVEALTVRYAAAYEEGLFYTDDTREIAQHDTEKHREPFVKLIRQELEIDG